MLDLLALLAQSTIPQTQEERVIVGKPYVIDGDTIALFVEGDERAYDIRLESIDAPELEQPNNTGIIAKHALLKHINERNVTCMVHGKDKYYRLLATCTAGDIMSLNQWMVSSGYAVAYTHFSDAYMQDEFQARALKRGLWAQGGFELPWVWRRYHK